MEGLITAFDADSFGEGFLQFLSSAMMLLPTVSTLLGIMAKMKDKDTEASKKNEKQSKKSEK
jgi:hypothetical protein